MKRILWSLMLLWLVSWAAPGAERASRPNILWLIAEDLGPQLGCWGTREVWTPNLDRLAAEGVRYSRFYSGHVC